MGEIVYNPRLATVQPTTDPEDMRLNPFFKNLRNWSLHTLIVMPFIVLIVTGGGLAGYLSYRNGQAGVHDLTLRLLNEVSSRIQTHLLDFLDTPPAITRLNANMFRSQHLLSENLPAVERNFLDYLLQYQVRGIFFWR